MESQVSIRITDVGGNNWSCPFSFCPKFNLNLRSSSALRSHVSIHLWRSRNECLSGRGLQELVQHLREQRRWLCGRCGKTYLLGSHCRTSSCGAEFVVSDGLPIFMPPGLELPVSREHAIQVQSVQEIGFEVFKPFDEDSEVFKKLRCLAIPTMTFIPKSCRSRVATCYAETIRAVNEVPDDLNRWGLMQIFVVSVLRSVSKEERGGASLSDLVSQRLVEWKSGGNGQRRLWQVVLDNGAFRERASVFSMEDQKKINVKRCGKLASLGRLGDAANALVSGGVLSRSPGVVEELARLHPYAPLPAVPQGQPPNPLVPSWEEVWRAVQSFPRGSTGGRDGLRPQLLLDMVQGVAGRMEEGLVQSAFSVHIALLLRGARPLVWLLFL